MSVGKLPKFWVLEKDFSKTTWPSNRTFELLLRHGLIPRVAVYSGTGFTEVGLIVWNISEILGVSVGGSHFSMFVGYVIFF